MKKYLLILISFFLIGCGGGSTTTSTSNSGEPVYNYGYLYDSSVVGVEYWVNGVYRGITDEDGKFLFDQSTDLIEFTLGKLYLGSVSGSVVQSQGFLYNDKSNVILLPTILGVYVSDYSDSKVIQLATLLQSLDENQNSDDGIKIADTTRTKLASINFTNFVTEDINESKLLEIVHFVDSNISLIPDANVSLHLQNSINKVMGISTDTLIAPKVVDRNNNVIEFNEIKTRHTTQRTIKIRCTVGSQIVLGEPDPLLYPDRDFDGNMSNIVYSDTNITIGSIGYANLTLDFNNDLKTHFNYFIQCKKDGLSPSQILHLDILKDHIPPYIKKPIIEESIDEEELLRQDVFAIDEDGVKYYEIIDPVERDDSVDNEFFEIDSYGTLYFKKPQNYEENMNKKYTVIARAWDTKNMTDVKIIVTLNNILDNPPILRGDGNFIANPIYEDHNTSEAIYDLDDALEDFSIAPDNNLSEMYYKLNNYTDILEVDSDGVITLRDDIDYNTSLINYELLPNSIDVNFSIINTNNHPTNDINETTGIVRIDIANKIDTTPALNPPANITIAENTPTGTVITTITKNELLSDSDLVMDFSIEHGNDENKFIMNNLGEVSILNPLDYETTKEYNLTIRATNVFNTSYDTSEHYDEVNITISISNVIDNPPVIARIDSNITIPENTQSDVQIASFEVNGTIVDENQTTGYEIYEVLKNNTLVYKKDDATFDDITKIPFTISNDGIVTTKRDLLGDYMENIDGNDTIFSVYVRANNTWWDGSSDNFSDPVLFDINVSNVIDNNPVLKTPATINFDFDENSSTPIGYELNITIELDGDNFDENNYTSFSFESGNTNNSFDINQSTGKIFVKNLLDWETTTSYNLTYIANNTLWDGTIVKSNPITLIININNIIEKVPKLSVPSTIDVHENWEKDDLITFIETNSNEVDELTIDSFSLVDPDDKFSVNTTPLVDNKGLTYGEITIKNLLDYETKSSHDITLRATNDFGFIDYNITVNVIDDVEKDLPFLVVAISYSDINITSTEADLETLFFTEIFGKSYLNDYFQRISKEKFSIVQVNESGGILNNGIIKTTLNDRNHTNSPTQLVTDIKDSLGNIDAICDFSAYDTNNDGSLTPNEIQFVFIIAGGDNYYTPFEPSISATSGTFNTLTLDGKSILSNYVAVGEMINDTTVASFGLIAKMIAKSLLGFQIDDGNYLFEKYGLMGTGFMGHIDANVSGSMPIHPTIYNKMKQGWVKPKLLRAGFSDSITFYNTHDNQDKFNSVQILKNGSFDQYYLIENRNKTTIGSQYNYDNGFDGLISGFNGGLIVWEVDETTNSIKRVPIANSYIDSSDGKSSNIFRPENSVNDLNIDARDIFEFSDVGSIDGDILDDGSKAYFISIEVK